MTEAPLSQLDGPLDARVAVDREGLLRLHSELRVEAPFEDFELVVLQAAAASVEVDRFALRVGHWRIDMPRRLLQTSVATGVLAAGIAAGGVSSVPVAVLAVVLPFLVDIDRIELRARDRIVLGRLRDLDARGGDPEAAYRRLPEDLRKQLTLMEFADVWDRLIEAGEIEPDGPNERARWKLPPQRGPRDDPDDPRYLPRPPA